MVTVAPRTMIRELKVYSDLQTHIPTTMARDLGIKDGDRVRWYLESGTLLLEKSPSPKEMLPPP